MPWQNIQVQQSSLSLELQLIHLGAQYQVLYLRGPPLHPLEVVGPPLVNPKASSSISPP